MAFVNLSSGIWVPEVPALFPFDVSSTQGMYAENTAAFVLDSSGVNEDRVALLGQINFLTGTTSATFSTASKIHYHTGTTTWGPGSASVVRIGLQGINTTTNPFRPDGSWSVYADLTEGVETITSSAAQSATMESGSVTLRQGQWIAVVWAMTTKGGSDIVRLRGMFTNESTPAWFPIASITGNAGSTWANSASLPLCMLECESGELAMIEGVQFFSVPSATTYTSSGTPDEYALQFQWPVPIKIGAVAAVMYPAAVTSAGNVSLRCYNTPAGTPAAQSVFDQTGSGTPGDTFTAYGVHAASTSTPTRVVATLATPWQLSANTDYAIGVEADSTSGLGLGSWTMANATHRGHMFGNTTFQRVSRVSNGNTSGNAFGSASTTVMPQIFFKIVAMDDGAGGGGGGTILKRVSAGGFVG